MLETARSDRAGTRDETTREFRGRKHRRAFDWRAPSTPTSWQYEVPHCQHRADTHDENIRIALERALSKLNRWTSSRGQVFGACTDHAMSGSLHIQSAEIRRLQQHLRHVLAWVGHEPSETRSQGKRQVKESSIPPQLDHALDQAYDKLDRLLAREHAEGSSPALEKEIAAAWSHLEVLEEAGCAALQRELDASVEQSPSKVETFLQRLERELADEEL